MWMCDSLRRVPLSFSTQHATNSLNAIITILLNAFVLWLTMSLYNKYALPIIT